MSNNPYSLRASLLKQAEGILMSRWQTENDQVREALHIKRDSDPSFNIDTITFPKFPTTEEIIAEAEKLYIFVQKK